MKLITILLITAFNCVALYFTSFLAVTGDGGSTVIFQVRIVGYLWIASLVLVSIIFMLQGSSLAIPLAAGTLPLGFFVASLAIPLFSYLYTFRPVNPAFEAICRDTGLRFIAPPATPVTSVAFDWPAGQNPPQFNYFTMDSRRNVSNLGRRLPSFPPFVLFAESRCCRHEGRPTNGVRPYIRRPNGGNYFGVSELSADVLVTFKQSDKEIGSDRRTVNLVEVIVVDRRDNRMLSTLKYALDRKEKRGCGASTDGIMDETAFITNAIQNK